MKPKRSSYLLFAASLLALTAQVHGTSMLHMDLGELTNRADKIFHGRVIGVSQGTVTAGGADLPAITYRFQVKELFKGEATELKGEQSIIEVRMVGTIGAPKPDDNGIIRFSGFRDVPRLNDGGDYVLFTTPESSIGLSVTVGLGQGAFRVYPLDGGDGEMLAVNEFNNAGLGLNGAGPVEYDKLSAQIRVLLGQ